MMFTFCPKCGGALEERTKILSVCASCSFEWYGNPKPVVNLILENTDGAIFLAKRKFSPSEGMWNLPGGFVNTGESLEEALAREINEELHINLNKPRYFASYRERYHYQGVHYYIVNVIFTDRQKNPKIVVGDDVSEGVFFAPADIPYSQISAPSERQAIKEYFYDNNHRDN